MAREMNGGRGEVEAWLQTSIMHLHALVGQIQVREKRQSSQDISTETHADLVDRDNALNTYAALLCSTHLYFIQQYTGVPLVQGKLTPLQRTLGVALVTAEVHNRDVLSELVKEGVEDAQNFLWQAQLRCVCSQAYVGSRVVHGPWLCLRFLNLSSSTDVGTAKASTSGCCAVA